MGKSKEREEIKRGTQSLVWKEQKLFKLFEEIPVSCEHFEKIKRKIS